MEPIDGPIRWGIAGTGSIASSFAADFARLGDGEIVAVGSRSADSAARFAAERGIGRAHGSYDALAADPDVDAIYVAGLHPVHAPQTEQFLDAGKHVLVEKPIALNAVEVDAMIAAAERNDRFLMEAMWMRFNPAHIAMMQRLDAGAIGEVRRIAADFSFALPFDETHRLWDRSKGGGALLDLGIYPVTLAWWTLGPPDRIDWTGHVATTGVDDEVALLCSWEGGASASVTTSLRLPGTMTARIEGTEGTIDLPAPAHCVDRFVVRRGAEVEEITAEAGGLHHQVAEVHRCLRAGERESPRMPLATSRAIIERFDRIRAGLGVRYDAD
ncbi:MAG: Gfo/Idh/MocA family oxidoreductase [Acidimicrobiales bacterium]